MRKITDKIKKWYRGENVEFWLNSDESVIINKKKTGAKIAKWFIDNWKVLVPVMATLIGVFVAAGVSLFIHFDNKSKGESAQKHGEAPKKMGTNAVQNLIIHNQSTSHPKKKLPQTKIQNKEIAPPEKASRAYARQQTERWRKEIQSFASGGSFNSQEFLRSSTYTEIYPYLSDKTMGQLSNRVVTIITSGRPTIEVQNEVLMALYEDLDRISAK